MKIIIRILINMAALVIAAYLLGDRLALTSDLVGLVIVAVVFGLVNTFIKPIIRLVSLPFSCLTLGLFTLLINMGMLLLTAYLVGDHLGFTGNILEVLVTAFLASILIGAVSAILTWVLPD
ncbi:MAG: phage holin family protein [Anaerolineales bacterium]|nr:phage holin family protein [Anaerolineales bacterium]